MYRHTKSITNGDHSRHIKWHIQPRRERPRAFTPTSHSIRGERHLGPRPEFASNPEERTPSLVLGASNPEGEAPGPSLSPIIITPVYYKDSRFHWIQLSTGISHVSRDSPISTEAVVNGSRYHGMQSQQSSAAIRAVMKGFQ